MNARRRGFSLVEVLVAATILIVGITALVVGVQVAIVQHEHNRKLALALQIAERRLEGLLLLFPTSSDLRDGRHPEDDFERFDPDSGRSIFTATPAPDDYRLFYTVTPSAITLGEDPIIGLRIELTIAWQESMGERSLVLRTAR
ncbi:MAG TPA: prepilin-type N-terminal cleavage/methylation domain-containing protein [Myxococcota bacterium]